MSYKWSLQLKNQVARPIAKDPFFHSDCTFEFTKNMFALYIKNIDIGPPLQIKHEETNKMHNWLTFMFCNIRQWFELNVPYNFSLFY